MSNLSFCYSERRRPGEAALLEQIVARMEKAYGRSDPARSPTSGHWGECTGTPGAWMTFHDTALLGGSPLGQKKYAEAEPLLLKGYEGLKAREKAIPPEAARTTPKHSTGSSNCPPPRAGRTRWRGGG
jgi:hypothetical protein